MHAGSLTSRCIIRNNCLIVRRAIRIDTLTMVFFFLYANTEMIFIHLLYIIIDTFFFSINIFRNSISLIVAKGERKIEERERIGALNIS